MWPFLRKHAPILLFGRGRPLVISELVLLIGLPAVVTMHLLSAVSGAPPLVFVGPWLGGLGLGLLASVIYYSDKNARAKRLKWRIGSNVKEPK